MATGTKTGHEPARMEDEEHSAQQQVPNEGSESPNHHHHHHHRHHHHHHHRDSPVSKGENSSSARPRGPDNSGSKESFHGVSGDRGPGSAGSHPSSRNQPQDRGAVVEESSRYGGRTPMRQRHHEVRCLNVLIYYGIVVSTFLLYSVGIIAYKLDENPDEVREFYRTITTEEVHTIFTRARTGVQQRGDASSYKCRSDSSADDCTATADRPSLAAGTVTEDEQWRRYIIVPSLPVFTSPSLRASSPAQVAAGNFGLQAQDASQTDTGDPFVRLLQAVATHEKARRRSFRQQAPVVRGAGVNTTVAVPFLTFPGLSHW